MSLYPTSQDFAIAIGRVIARRLFAKRGNHSEVHLSEVDLAAQVAAGAAIARQVDAVPEVYWKLKEDPNWRPYCLNCPSMDRMVRTQKGHFFCSPCGLTVDESMQEVK